MVEQPINPNTEIDIALRRLKAQRERERNNQNLSKTKTDDAELKEAQLQEEGIKDQEKAQGRYGKIGGAIGIGSGLNALLYTESGRKMLQNQLGVNPEKFEQAKKAKELGQHQEALQLQEYYKQTRGDDLGYNVALSNVQLSGKGVNPEVLKEMKGQGFFTNQYSVAPGVKGRIAEGLYGAKYAGPLHGATDGFGGFAKAAAYTGMPVLPSLSLGFGSAMASRRQRTYAQQKDQLGTSGRVAERMGALGSARNTATLAPGAALFGMSHLPGVGGLAGSSGLAFKGAMKGVTAGVGKGILDTGAGMAKLAGAKGMSAGLTGMASGSIAPLIAGGLALSLPSIIGGIAGAKAEQKRRRLRGKREPFFRVEKKYSQSGAIDSLVQRLVSAEAIQPADQLKIELLKMIESHTSPIAKITEIVDYLDQQRDKDVKESTKQYDEQIQEWDVDEKDSWKKRIGRGMDRMSLGLQKFNAYNPFQQLATLILEGKTPDKVFKELRQIQKDRDTAKDRKEHYRQVASQTGMMMSEVRLLLTPASILTKMGDSPESKMIILQSGIFDVLRGIATRDIEHKNNLKLQFDSDEDDDQDSKWYEKVPFLAGLSPLFKLAKGGFNFGKDVYKDGIGSAISSRAGQVKDKVKGKYDSLIGDRLKKWSMGEDLYEHMKDPNKLKKEMGLIKTGQEKRETFMEKALPGKLDQITTYQGQTVELLRSINNNIGQIVVSMGGIADQPEGKIEGMIYDDISGQYLNQRDYDKLIKEREKAYNEKVEGMTKTTDKGFFGNVKESAVGGLKGGALGFGSAGLAAGTIATLIGASPVAIPGLLAAGLIGGGTYGLGKGVTTGISKSAPGDILEMFSKFGKQQDKKSEVFEKDKIALEKFKEIEKFREEAPVTVGKLEAAKRATYGSGPDSEEQKEFERLQKVQNAQLMSDQEVEKLRKESTKYKDRYRDVMIEADEASSVQLRQTRVARTLADQNLNVIQKLKGVWDSIGSDVDDWKLFRETQSRKDWITGGIKSEENLEIQRNRIAREKAKNYAEKLGLSKQDVFEKDKTKEASKTLTSSPFRPTIIPTAPSTPPTPPQSPQADDVPEIIPFPSRGPRRADDYESEAERATRRASGDFATLPEGGTVKFTQRRQIIVDPGEELHKPSAAPKSNLPALPPERSSLTVLQSINKNIGDLVEESKTSSKSRGSGGKLFDVVGGNRNVGMEIDELKAEQERELKKKQAKVITDNLGEILEHLKAGFGTKKGGAPIDKKKGGLFGMLGGLFSSLMGPLSGILALLGGLGPLLASVPVALGAMKLFDIKFGSHETPEETIGKSKIAIKGTRATLRTAATVIDKGAEATKVGKLGKAAIKTAAESKTAATVATGATKAVKAVKESAAVGKVIKTADTVSSTVKATKAGSAVVSGVDKVTDLVKAAKATDVGSKAIKAGKAASKVVGSGAKAVGTLAKNVTKKVAVKSLATMGKKLPVVGALIGTGLAAWRLSKGDKLGAAMEFSSGLAGMIPGPGTLLSIGIDAALLAKDIAEARKNGTVTPEMEAEEKKKLEELKAISTPEAWKLIGNDIVKFDKLKDSKKIKFDKKVGLWRVSEPKAATSGLKQPPTEKSIEPEDRTKIAQASAVGITTGAIAKKSTDIPKANASESGGGFFSRFKKSSKSLASAAISTIPGIGGLKLAKDALSVKEAHADEISKEPGKPTDWLSKVPITPPTKEVKLPIAPDKTQTQFTPPPVGEIKAKVAPDKTQTQFTPPPVGEIKAKLAPDKTRKETEKKKDIASMILDSVNRIADILTEGFGMEGTRTGLKKQQKEQELVRKKMIVGISKPELEIKSDETPIAPPIPTAKSILTRKSKQDLPTILPGKPVGGKIVKAKAIPESMSKEEMMKNLLRHSSTPKLQQFLKQDISTQEIRKLFAQGRIKLNDDSLYDLYDRPKASKVMSETFSKIKDKIDTVKPIIKDKIEETKPIIKDKIEETKPIIKDKIEIAKPKVIGFGDKLKSIWNQFIHGDLLNQEEIKDMYKPGGKAEEIKKSKDEYIKSLAKKREKEEDSSFKMPPSIPTVPSSPSISKKDAPPTGEKEKGFFAKVVDIWKKEWRENKGVQDLKTGFSKHTGVDASKELETDSVIGKTGRAIGTAISKAKEGWDSAVQDPVKNQQDAVKSKKKGSSSSLMDPSLQEAFKKQVMAHEGVVLHEYKDSLGYPTIGVGHLIKRGEQFPDKITLEQAKALFDKDFQKHLSDAATGLPIWKNTDDVRRGALLDMTFNMGVGGVRKFKNTLAALDRGDYDKTAMGVLNSRYAKQVGKRAVTNANLLRTGDPAHIVRREPAVYAEKGAYYSGDLTSMQERFFGGPSIPAEIHPNEAIVPLKDKGFQNELTNSLKLAVDKSSGGFGKVTQSLLAIADKLEQVVKKSSKGELKAGKISNEQMKETRQIVSPRKFEDTDTGKALLRQQSQVRVPEYTQVPSVSNSGKQQGSVKHEQLRPINEVGAAVLESIFSNTITNFEGSAKQFALGQNPFRILR